MLEQFSRTESLIGKDKMKKLNQSKVIIYGIGGVGSYVVEGLSRAGIGNFILVDFDKYDITNINRQIGALHSTIGKYKIDVMKERILDINPNANVQIYKPDDIEDGETSLIKSDVDYIVDAIDSMKNKIEIIEKANMFNIPIITSAGTANKVEPMKFEVTDIFKTSICPVCKILRKELKKKNIEKLKVVYSKEEPRKNENNILGSISFVPSVVGLIIAREVIKDILGDL